MWEWGPSARETLCDRIDSLEVHMRIGDHLFDGTFDTLWVGFDGANTLHKMVKSPDAGFQGWTTIPLGPVFQDGLKLRANCFNSPLRVHYNDYSSINANLRVGGKYDIAGYGQMYHLWNDTIDPNKWTASPPCSHVTQLTVTLEIEGRDWAGTYNSLYAIIGKEYTLIHREATRREVYTVDIHLYRAFGEKIVNIDELKELAILSQGSHDQVFPKSINVRAICAGHGRKTMNVERDIKKWMAAGERWTLSLAPEEWNEF
ncbi:hypothetical protein CDD80_4636 [Ophiocordyceps camponoti-rufipedis]|uniref:Uncharacterized protein n=1 Tax=Ophiocordyceps camponoti-rufipedis TaxID=2004952 RepID=A0A2C5YRX7_9HYPO|nr:hypothetical protein CDD80_4636 [Ophiocordyceps camponoti-rufipedis]